jgi:hypothetical protein
MRVWPLLLVLAACAPEKLSTVPLDDGWPKAIMPYPSEYERWTRRGLDRNDLIQTLTVSATLHAAEFRAAYAHERARRLALSAEEEAQITAEERKAAGDAWEIELLVATAKPEWQDFARIGAGKQPGSMWRVVLVGDDGREVTPSSVRQDKRHREDIHAYYPDLMAFFQPYVVRFPKATPDGRPLVAGKGTLALKVGGSVGQVTLTWKGE